MRTIKRSVRKALGFAKRWVLRKFFEIRLSIEYLISGKVNPLNNFMVVTGADSTHYKSLNQFLFSIRRYEPDIKVVVFDLGLTKPERQHLENDFPTIEFRTFDYTQYPDYFNIKINSGEYAWKPVILCDILNEFKGCVCWMDAGNVVTKPLFWMQVMIKKSGMYSTYSHGCITDWTHPKTLEFLHCSNNLYDKRNLSAACVAVCYKNAKAKAVLNRWKSCALIKDCIAPEGSSRKNHRQDQAVLSVIAHQSGITKNMDGLKYGYHGFKLHQDID